MARAGTAKALLRKRTVVIQQNQLNCSILYDFCKPFADGVLEIRVKGTECVPEGRAVALQNPLVGQRGFRKGEFVSGMPDRMSNP